MVFLQFRSRSFRSAYEGPNRGFDRFGKCRPRGHERGEFGVGNAPFGLFAGTPGGTPGTFKVQNPMIFRGICSSFQRLKIARSPVQPWE